MPEPQQRRSQTKPVGVFARWLLPSLGSLSLLLILFVLVNNSWRFLLDSDTGWHIRTGELILRERSVPRRDPFSHTMEGREWFAWEWLTDLGMAGMHRWRGLAGVVAGAFLILLISFVALYQMMIRRGADALIACMVTLFGALATIVHWLARPHLVSIAMMILWYWVVEAYRRERTQWIWVAPLIVAFWANLHGAFVITFVVLAIYAAGEWLESAFRGRWWGDDIRRTLATYGLVAASSVVASLATPFGFNLYGHLWRYLTDSALLASINEFRSPDFHLPDGKLIEVLLLLGAVAAVNAVRQRRFVETGLLLLWGHLTLQSERHVTLAVVMLAPVIAEQWSYLLAELGDRIAGLGNRNARIFRAVRDWYRGTMAINAQLNGVFVLLAVAVFAIAAPARPWGEKILSPRFDPNRHPVEAADFVLQSSPPGLLFANDQFGGYLIYRLYPKIKVFVDGRSDFYRQGDVLEMVDKLMFVRPQWQKTLADAGVTWMVLPRESPLALIAKMSGEWATIHQDQTAEILVLKTKVPSTQAVTGSAESGP
ncbi:MAG: hypothetical protein ACREEM_43695 [Blastocatellia bacterium]